MPCRRESQSWLSWEERALRVMIKFQDLPVEKLKAACSCQGMSWADNEEWAEGRWLSLDCCRSHKWLLTTSCFSTCCHMEGPELT